MSESIIETSTATILPGKFVYFNFCHQYLPGFECFFEVMIESNDC